MSGTNCPSCNTPVPQGAMFCDNCGFDLRNLAAPPQPPIMPTFHVPQPSGGLICPTCGSENLEGSVFCESCGTKLTAIPAAPAQPPPPPAPVYPASFGAPPVQPAQVQVPAAPAYTPPPQVQSTGIPGRVLIQTANVSLPIPQGKTVILIGREDPVSGIFPEIDLDPYGGQEAGVGRKHAQMTYNAGQVFIEDLESVNGTVVNHQRLSPRQPRLINNGDEIRLGKMILIYFNS